MWRSVDLVWTDVSEEPIASIFTVEKSAREEPVWAGGSSRAFPQPGNSPALARSLLPARLAFLSDLYRPYPSPLWYPMLPTLPLSLCSYIAGCFRLVAQSASHMLTLLFHSRIFLPWRWRRYVTPNRRFTQDVHGATSHKMAFFIVTAVKTSNPTTLPLLFRSAYTLHPVRQHRYWTVQAEVLRPQFTAQCVQMKLNWGKIYSYATKPVPKYYCKHWTVKWASQQ
jgi:hypothetical protein